jgi:hypothetical protein
VFWFILTKTHRLLFRLVTIALVLAPWCSPSFGQRARVLAPHVPVAPRLTARRTWSKPSVHQSAVGGLWMTDANSNAALYLKNGLKTDPLTVTPSLYLSNGVRYTLSPVILEPSGTAVIDINKSLAQQGLAPYAPLYGYAAIDYQHPWAAVSATVRNVDSLNSVIFVYPLVPPPDAFPQKDGPPGDKPISYKLEGMWWKQEANVSGFLALANVTGQPINTTICLTDNLDAPLATYQVTVSPHGTKMVAMDQLKTSTTTTGGVYLSHDGDEHGLDVNGGLVDLAVGYSARLPFLPSAQEQPAPTMISSHNVIQIAELGLMTGVADPMMNFPSGTVFTPYSILRNITDQAVSVTPTLSWMAGGAEKSVQLPTIKIAPHRTFNLQVMSLLAAAGLKEFNGNLNVVLDSTDEGLVLASGSVDQKNTYVFEVIPGGVGESASKAICYWSTKNGDDTMITLWNPADEAQELTFTLFYSGGHYLYPIHLAPRATRAMNISEILLTSIPDVEGNVIPAGVDEGSAEIAGSQGEHEHILVSMDAAIYNVRKAICGVTCVTCNGVVSGSIEVIPVVLTTSLNHQEIFYEQWNTGGQYDHTKTSSWNSTATSVATVNAGLVTGVAAGTFNMNASDLYFEAQFIPTYCTPAPVCPTNELVGASGQGTVQQPAQLLVLGDVTTTGTNCPNTKIRIITYQIQDSIGIDIKDDNVQTKEQFASKGTNTCLNPIKTSDNCGATPAGIIHDTLSVGCNTVGNGCGFTFKKQQWLWCHGTASTVIGTIGDLVVQDNKISVNGSYTTLKGKIFDEAGMH